MIYIKNQNFDLKNQIFDQFWPSNQNFNLQKPEFWPYRQNFNKSLPSNQNVDL